ncbi:MAG: bifunctional folylpolyglutamate synthase/dihydrofolate synthase [Chloroflexi bacterium]|nr:bifunctional folylpolyglutamate synthase/dihydrofolate synthase [Chloroflexota bacterium]
MNYAAALDFLLSRTDYERYPGFNYAIRFDLRRMDDLLQRLGNPHRSARSVHIAGSKGKGSTSAMIAAALQAAGYKVGLYTSPHLLTLRERIQVDGKPILKSELESVVAKIKPHVEAVDRDGTYGELSTFELLTTAAFVYFQQRNVDYQVLEVGLGGRLDATNVVMPEVCVITSISLDHTDVLGDTLAKIAAEKAGIVKERRTVVSSPQAEEAAAVIRYTCLKKNAPLISVGNDVTWQKTGSNLSGQSLEVNGCKGTYQVTIPLLGAHQLDNAATAVAALETLGLSRADMEKGLANTRWPGRLQVLGRKPLLVIDGAHNRDSAKKLKDALRDYFQFDRLILIIGTSADKDVSGIVGELAPVADAVIVTRSRHPRATRHEVLVAEFTRLGRKAEVAGTVAEAVAKAKKRAGRGDLICATGSLFLIAEVIEYVKGLRPEVYAS